MPDDPNGSGCEPTNASLIDAHIAGIAAASAKEPREAPLHFTTAAKAEWFRAYDRIVALREAPKLYSGEVSVDPMVQWRREAKAWAEALLSVSRLGSVSLTTGMAKIIADYLFAAEPPGSYADGATSGQTSLGVMTYSRRVEEVAIKVVRKEAPPSELTAAIRESAEEISQAILRQVERARRAG